ncbi:MAG: T9SS type A sorting domain-containing protein [Cytophagales bacterium]
MVGNIKLNLLMELLRHTNFTKTQLRWLKSFIIYFFGAFVAYGQTDIFLPITNIPVSVDGRNLENAWAGGVNSALISTCDLDNDNIPDLIIFDKTSEKLTTFLLKDGKYVHSPAYELYFPKIRSWMKMVDFDGDGKKDIFTSGLFPTNIGLYKNTGTANNLSWELVTDQLASSILGSGMIEIECSSSDYPSISDIDNDGDIDIVSYEALGSSGLAYHINRSKEVFDDFNHLVFEKYTACYGKMNIGNGNCSKMVNLNQKCLGYGGSNDKARLLHNGISINIFDADGDDIKDILMGDVECGNLNVLYNVGTNSDANVTSVGSSFPSSYPINIHKFPVTFFEDVDGDNVNDLLATPNIFDNDDDLTDFQNSLWYYKNIGTNALPNYSFVGKNFLQKDMLDFGENTFPVLQDIDNDGDIDLLVANKGLLKNNEVVSSIYLYKNVGSKDSAQFVFETDDYLNFSTLLLYNLRIGFAQVDENDSFDLYFMATDFDGSGKIYFIANKNLSTQPLAFDKQDIQPLNITAFRLPPVNNQIFDSFTKSDYVHIFKYKNELKLLFGTKDATIQLYKNTFVNGIPNFTFELDNFLNTSDFNYTKQAVKAITYLKSGDSLDIYTTDNSGEMAIYKLSSLYDTKFEVKKSIVFDRKNNTVQPTNLGSGSSFAIADFNNDTLPDLVIGTKAGGLSIYQNVSPKKVNPDIPPPTTIDGPIIIPPPNTIVGLNTKYFAPKPFNIYPNPASSYLNIESRSNLKIDLVDIFGRILLTYQNEKNAASGQINTSGLPNGIYYLQIEVNSHLFYEKVVIERQ